MINPYYLTERAIQVGFNITLESHHINQANSKIIIKPNYAEFGIEVRYVNKISKEMASNYARLINQYKLKYHRVFSASFDKQDDNQVFDENEQYIILNNFQKLTENDIDNIDTKSPLEQQIQNQKLKSSGWNFDKISSLTIYFYKTTEMNGSSYVKLPLRISSIFGIRNDDKYFFLWSILAYLHPYKNSHCEKKSN